MGQAAQLGVKTGRGRDHAHIGRRRFGDHGCDPVTQAREDLPQRGGVVVRQDHRVCGGCGGHPGAAGQALGRQPRAGRDQQRIAMPVIVPGKFDNYVTTGGAAGQPDCRHGGLGAGGDQPDLFGDRDPGPDPFRQLDFGPGRGTETQPPRSRRLDRGHHLRVGMPQQRRAPGADQVDVAAALDVADPAAGGFGDESGSPAHRRVRPYRGVHPTWDRLAGPGHPVPVQPSHPATSSAQ